MSGPLAHYSLHSSGGLARTVGLGVYRGLCQNRGNRACRGKAGDWPKGGEEVNMM